MEEFIVRPASIWERAWGYLWGLWYRFLHNERRKRDLFLYRERKRLSEPHKLY